MKRTSRLRQGLLIVAALLALYSIVGFLVLPMVVKSQLEQRLGAELGRRVTVEKVRFNPYQLTTTIENLAIFETDGTTPFLGWRRLHLNVDGWNSLWREWTASEVVLDGFKSRVAINPDQSLNFSDILKKFSATQPQPAAPPAKPGRPLHVGSFRVTDAQVDFSDRSLSRPFASKLGPLSFTVTEFRTASQNGAPYRFEAVSESGEKFAWSGTLQAEPPASRGELTIENFLLAKYSAYHADRLRADITDGKLTFRAHYEVNLAEGKHVARVSEGSLEVRSMKIIDHPGGETVVDLPTLDIKGIQADGVTQKAQIKSIALGGGQIKARREKDNSINLLTMLEPGGNAPPKQPASATPTPAAAPSNAKPATKPEFTIGELSLKDFRVNVSDQAAPRPAELALSDVQLSLRNISLAPGTQMPLQVAFNWAPQGTVRLDGNIAIAPVKADLTLDVASLELLPLTPYLEQFVNVRLTGGALSAGLSIEASMQENQPLAATVMGGVKAEKFGLVDGQKNEELAGFSSLTLTGIRASTTPELSIHLDEINLAGPVARIVLNQDKTLNVGSVVRPEKASESGASPASPPTSGQDAAPTAAAPAAALPKIEIGKVVLSDGDFRFSDRSVEPNVNMAINQFGGTVTGLSSTKQGKAEVDMKAMVDGAGPISVTGAIDPFSAKKSLDLKVDFKNVDLVPLSPYSGKFAGYELARGKLVLDVKASVADNKVDSANVITLHHFTFGSPVESPEATKLPVRLGVALLKDLEGKIVIDVPVQGTMDDPSFKVSRVVWRVIGNLLTKAATSPFALLGAAFGGGGDELAFQDFEAGSAKLRPDETKKLDTMVKALTNRPSLNVELQGSYDRAADAQSLKAARLADVVRRNAWEQKRATNPNIASPAQLTLTPDEEAVVLKRLFDRQFPPGTPLGTPVPPPPEKVQPPPPPASVVRRIVDVITLQSGREEREAEKENARRAAEHAKAVEAATATGVPADQMRSRLAEAMTVDDNDLRALAQARAQAVRDYLTNVGHISTERLFLGKDKADPAKEAKGARVYLALQ